MKLSKLLRLVGGRAYLTGCLVVAAFGLIGPNQGFAAETVPAICSDPPRGAGVMKIEQLANVVRDCRKAGGKAILDALSWMYADTITIRHHPGRDIDGVLKSANQIKFERAIMTPAGSPPDAGSVKDVEVTVVGNVIVLSETTSIGQRPLLLFPYRDGKLVGSEMWYDASTLPPSVDQREKELMHLLGK
jgi:hypothetical protein